MTLRLTHKQKRLTARLRRMGLHARTARTWMYHAEDPQPCPLQPIRLRQRGKPGTGRLVHVETETETAWFGRPVANNNCPVLEWPKFAWEREN